ncbi:hypothetical protein SARC_12850, partial [Sphaeroforma arctica JP610]
MPPPKRHLQKKKSESPTAANPHKQVKHPIFLKEAMSKKATEASKEASASKEPESTKVTSAYKAPDVSLTSQVTKATSASTAPDPLVDTSPEEGEVAGLRLTRGKSKEIASSLKNTEAGSSLEDGSQAMDVDPISDEEQPLQVSPRTASKGHALFSDSDQESTPTNKKTQSLVVGSSAEMQSTEHYENPKTPSSSYSISLEMIQTGMPKMSPSEEGPRVQVAEQELQSSNVVKV